MSLRLLCMLKNTSVRRGDDCRITVDATSFCGKNFSEHMNIHLQAHGQKSGPFSLEEVNQQIAGGGIILATTSAWYEGCADWMPLTHVQGVVVPASMATSIGPPPLYGAQQGQVDATGGVIPYKNPKALTAYYLGVFGLIPVFGPLLAIPAIILGVLGLKAIKDGLPLKEYQTRLALRAQNGSI